MSVEARVSATRRVRQVRVDDEPILHGPSSQQHREEHRVPVRQGELYGPRLRPQFSSRNDDQSLLGVPAGVADVALVEHFRSTPHDNIASRPERMYSERDEPYSPLRLGLDIESVQRRGLCASIDLGFQGRDTEIRQCHPLPPSDDRSTAGHVTLIERRQAAYWPNWSRPTGLMPPAG